MNKRTRIILIVAVLTIGGYLAYRYISNRNQGNGSPTGSLGTNLNSVAPELVGGSSGPAQGPAVQLPVNITLTTTETQGQSGKLTPANNQTTAAVQGLNTPVSHSNQSGHMTSPMRAGNARTKDKLSHNSKAAGKTSHQSGNGVEKTASTPATSHAAHHAAASKHKTGAKK